MRILLVNKFWYEKGGAERYTFLLKDLLESHGHTVIPFAMADERNVSTPWAEYFVPHVDFWDADDAIPNQTRFLEKASRVLWSKEAARAIEAVLDEARPDIVHLQNFAHQISPSILPVIRARGIPVVWTLHDYKAMCPNFRMYTNGAPCERCNGKKYWNAVRFNCMGSRSASFGVALEMTLHHAIFDVYGKHLSAVIAPSTFMAERLAAWGWEGRVEVIPNVVLTSGSASAARGGGQPVLFVGRLVAEKGIEEFLEVARRTPEIPFAIVGDGPLAPRCVEIATRCPNVQYLGRMERAAVAAQVSAAAIVCVPSRWYENAPYVVLEAFAAGVPVIASAIGGLPELVVHGETGLLVSPGDVDALDKTVEMLYHDGAQRMAMGTRARQRAADDYGPARHYEQLIRLYDALTRTGAA